MPRRRCREAAIRGATRPYSLSSSPELRAEVLEPDDLDRSGQRRRQRIELRQLDKAARCDDDAQPRRAARRQKRVRANRVVEHRRDAAGRLQCEKRDAGADRIRQHDADRLAAFGAAGQKAAEHEARCDDAVVAQRAAGRVGHDRMLAAVVGAGREQREEQAGRIGAARHHVRHRVIEHQPGPVAARPAAQLGRYRKPARLVQRDRHLREPAPAQPAPMCAASRENGVNSTPSIRTGRTGASPLSAISAGPS